jgi:hypothetical protein
MKKTIMIAESFDSRTLANMEVAPAASSHMPMTMTVAALYEDDAVTAGEHIRVCGWHRQRR